MFLLQWRKMALKRKSDVGDNHTRVKAPKRVVRKHDPEYEKCGFLMAGSDAEPKAQCVERVEILSLSNTYIFSVVWSCYIFLSFIWEGGSLNEEMGLK